MMARAKKMTRAEKLERISRGTGFSPGETLLLIKKHYPKAYRELMKLP